MIIHGSTSTHPQPVDLCTASPAPTPPEMPAANPVVANPAASLERSLKTLDRHLERALICSQEITRAADRLAAEGPEKGALANFVEQTHAKRIRAEMWTLQLRQCCAVIAHTLETAPLNETQRQQLDDQQSEILRSLKQSIEQSAPPEIAEALDATINSSNDFFEKLLELIDLIKNGYLAGYEHIISAYSDFFSDFNTEITAMMKDWVEGVNDGKEVELSAGPLREALEKLIAKYSLPNPAAMLFPAPPDTGASKEEAEKWLKALGLPDSCLQQNPKPNGPWCVVIDLGPLNVMHNGLKDYGDKVKLDTAAFNAWQTGFNAQEELLKNRLQSFTQKYSNANAYHDNFNKTLSAHLNQFGDMLRAMLNF
ncbi:type III secretion system translocon protein, IpaD/SipD family [Pseudomonas sp. NFACC24-1]|uniref:IpaD/SipD/SspD family type III secretion system needle tip protein n=1 Tax=Pseudomonas sp. NFACC24-1 TaxID=1566189 RepID=UPI0008E59B46|nr:IpaD/SipD/SspD family type III secretion system needle tip protein [Pseudomonas sp. NFACC24-1]SFN54523.1 type III secretion system translocon protein, IpaD/SipD family [Pseudomonas sp. NFACC24-1]